MGIIEPEPGFQFHGSHAPARHLAGGPLGCRRFHIALDAHGGSGIRSVQQQLDPSVPLVELTAEIRRHPEDGVDFPLLHGPECLIHTGHISRPEVFRPIHEIHHLLGLRRRIFQHHPNGGVLYIQADAIADYQDQDDGQQDAQGQAGIVPEHFPELLHRQSPDPAQIVFHWAASSPLARA